MIMFGVMLLVIYFNQTALALLTVHSVPHNLLMITIIVNQAKESKPCQMIHYGMASSVKVPVALVPTLPHGSVYSFLLQQLMQLKSVFVVISDEDVPVELAAIYVQ